MILLQSKEHYRIGKLSAEASQRDKFKTQHIPKLRFPLNLLHCGILKKSENFTQHLGDI